VNKIMQLDQKNFLSVNCTFHSAAQAGAGRPSRTLPEGEQVLALANTPNVRAAEVARGKALIADPDYPSPRQMRQIARVLVATLG
jgi:hypothetical protein